MGCIDLALCLVVGDQVGSNKRGEGQEVKPDTDMEDPHSLVDALAHQSFDGLLVERWADVPFSVFSLILKFFLDWQCVIVHEQVFVGVPSTVGACAGDLEEVFVLVILLNDPFFLTLAKRMVERFIALRDDYECQEVHDHG